MKTYFALSLFLFILNGESFAQKHLTITAGGAKYEILRSQNGKKIELGDVITVNFKMLTPEGKTLYSSYNNPDVYKLQVHSPEEVIDLMEVFVQLHDKDSAIVFIPADSIYRKKEAQRPEYLPPKSALVFLIKIEAVQTVEEVLQAEKVAFEKEREQLRTYLKENKLEPKVTGSGLLYLISEPGRADNAAAGDTVYFNYLASSIGGSVFDTNLEAEARKAGLNYAGRQYKPISFVVGETGVITPWDEVFMLLNQGSKAKLIIPSFLAFGPRGLGKMVKPYTTFVIDVEVVKIRKPLRKSYAEKNESHLKPSEKAKGFNYLPREVVKNLSSFLILLDDPKKKAEERSYKGLQERDKQWYMIWWNSIIRVLN